MGTMVSNSIAAELADERERQCDVHGFNGEHDDRHSLRTLCGAVISFAAHAGGLPATAEAFWPFSPGLPNSIPRRSLVKSGAMIIAAIEWIDRKEAKK